MPPREEYDVISIGSGLSGLTTALFAARAGLRCLVLEKTATIGGSSCWSHGVMWVGDNAFAAAAGIPDSRQDALDYLNFLGSGDATPARTETMVDHANIAMQALLDAGIQLRLVEGLSDIMVGRAPGSVSNGRTIESPPVAGSVLGDLRDKLRVPPLDAWRLTLTEFVQLRKARMPETDAIAAKVAADELGQGAALVAQLIVALRDLDVPILTDHAVDSLIVEDGRVAGVTLADGRSYGAARGVMIATGHYLADKAMREIFERLPGYRNWFAEGNDGDGIRLASPAGGSIGISRNNRMIMLGYEWPSQPSDYFAGEPTGAEIPRAHTMIVNAKGKRFGNESLFQEMAPAFRVIDPETRTNANLPCWFVFDTQYANIWGFAEAPPGQVPGWVPSADDLATLAHKAGIDPQGLEETARRYNHFAETGVDEDFGRRPAWSANPPGGQGKNPSLASIAQAPFYAVQLFPTGGASAGLRADTAARVLDWRERPIPGLYAAGDVTHHDEFGAGYQAGVTYTTAFTYAYLAVGDMETGGSTAVAV